jgi:nicotinate-nucleotide adenylyltransferase
VRYGILGGSFDPVHEGHLAAAEGARGARGLDAVFLVPAASPPHKDRGCVASFEDRVAMARLAARGREGLFVLDLEGRRPGPSYTVDTVDALRAAHPGAGFELLVGADMLEDLPRWRDARRLVGLVRVVAFRRPGADWERAVRAFEAAFGPGGFDPVDVPPVDVSATALRRLLASGADPGGLLPAPVLAFIRGRGLYSGG